MNEVGLTRNEFNQFRLALRLIRISHTIVSYSKERVREANNDHRTKRVLTKRTRPSTAFKAVIAPV